MEAVVRYCGNLLQGGRMTTIARSNSWVVYKMTICGKPSGLQAVCEQGEWEAMELARPGYHMLVLGGITNEGEAERLARIPAKLAAG
jgi:hypothetical protein